MSQASLLKTLYCQSSFNRTAPLKAVVESLLDGTCLEERLISQALSNDQRSVVSATQSEILEKWRELLTLVLVLRFKNCLQVHMRALIKSLRDLQRISLWPEHQLLSLYQSIVAVLLGQSAKEFVLEQHVSGYCPFESNGYTLFAELPQPFFQAEMGVLLCLFSELTSRNDYLESAVKLAEWQRHTLDHHYSSFVGLLSKEGEASERLLAVNNFLLFNAVAKSANRQDMAFFAQKQLERLYQISLVEPVDISSWSIVLEYFFDDKILPTVSGEYYLPSIVCDEQLALVGSRSSESSAIATLYGGTSGMGSYHHKDVKVISFGPQHLPLGDCSGFGQEGGGSFLADHIKVLSVSTGEFLLEGAARLAPYVSVVPADEVPSGRWMESRQKLKHGILSIETKFQGLFEQSELVFSFFVKCKHCVIDGGQTIRPRSLNRYHGRSAPLKLQGQDASISLLVGQGHEEMHVIPLGGGDNFWGADFLIAYLLKDTSRSYSWQLTP